MAEKEWPRDFEAFGCAIKDRRQELGMTQEGVAERVGVKPNYVGYLERGLRKPSDEILLRISDVLGLDPKRLFFLANPQIKEFIEPPEEPPLSSWETFARDRQLHKRQGISEQELRFLKGVSELGEVQTPRDYLFILNIVRQAISRG